MQWLKRLFRRTEPYGAFFPGYLRIEGKSGKHLSQTVRCGWYFTEDGLELEHEVTAMMIEDAEEDSNIVLLNSNRAARARLNLIATPKPKAGDMISIGEKFHYP